MTLGIKKATRKPPSARHWYRNRSMKTISSMNRIIIGRKLQKVRSFHTKMRDLIDISEIVTKTSVRKRNNWRYTYQAFHTELFRCLQWNWITHYAIQTIKLSLFVSCNIIPHDYESTNKRRSHGSKIFQKKIIWCLENFASKKSANSDGYDNSGFSSRIFVLKTCIGVLKTFAFCFLVNFILLCTLLLLKHQNCK